MFHVRYDTWEIHLNENIGLPGKIVPFGKINSFVPENPINLIIKY